MMLGLACRMMSSFQRFGYSAGCAILLVLMLGCASPGPPRAPSLHLPGRVTGFSAERRGDAVVVRFKTPQQTTDKEPLRGAVTASLCRAVADGPCHSTSSFPGKVTVAGQVEWVDVLPSELTSGALRRLSYRVELFNAQDRSAGPSEPVFAVGGEAPRRVDGLYAEGSHGGIVLRWTPEAQVSGDVLVEREALNPAPKKKEPKSASAQKDRSALPASMKQSKDESLVWLHAADSASGGDRGGMIDTTASADEPYRYTAVRSRSVTIDGRKLEMRSGPSVAVEITLRDVFPPAVPQGVVAAGFPVEGSDRIAVDLVWQPNTESDLAGYNVYRQAADGTAVKLTAKPVALPAFHDATAAHGVSYRYTVTAVDAKGNESAASAAAELVATP
jgi:hypothetical protein